MRLETGTFVLVSDAGKALLLQNKGDADILDLRVIDVLQDENPPSRDQGRDRPGRFRTPDGGKAAAEDTDWHEARETAFLARVAEVTLKTVAASTPADLVLAADPRSLGKLRGLLAGAGSIRLIAEVHRDLAHQSVPLIEEAITSV